MQTLTFVCRQDFGTWIMHCYSWIGRYRDMAACVCVYLCSAECVLFRTHCKCSFSACQCVSPWLWLPRDCFVHRGKVKGTVRPNLTAKKKPCRHMHVCFREPRISSLLHFLAFYLQTNTVLSDWRRRSLQTPSWVKRLRCWHVDSRKGKKTRFQHQGGRLHLIYLTWECETCLSYLLEVIFCIDEDGTNTGALM